MARYVSRCARRRNAARGRNGKPVGGKPAKSVCTHTGGSTNLVRRQSHKGTKLNTWQSSNMQHAIEEWQKQKEQRDKAKISIRTIARAWQVPYETLRRRIYGRVSGFGVASGRPTVLAESDESELVQTIKDMAAAGFPMTRKDVQGIAYAFAVEHGLKGFSEKKLSAGYYWFEGFLNRHPDVNIKKAENLSVVRAMSMNRPQVYAWFDRYDEFLSRLGIQFMPRNIWNLDETGLQNIHKAEAVVAPVGLPSYNVTAVEKGETSTVVAIVNAYGDVPAPMIIHRGKSVGKGWKDGAPFGTLVKASESGWINKELFVEFGQHFVSFLQKEGLNTGFPHALVMDNHYAHIFNLEFLQKMKTNNIHVFALPSHTTHWLQPLDRVPFGALKRNWNEEVRLYTRNLAGVKLEKKCFFKVFTPVWQRSMTVDLAQAGFRATGLFPINRQVIPEDAFAPSTVTDRGLPQQLSTDTSEPSSSNLFNDQAQVDEVLISVSAPLVTADQLPVSTGLPSDDVEASAVVAVPLVVGTPELSMLQSPVTSVAEQLLVSASSLPEGVQPPASVVFSLDLGEKPVNPDKSAGEQSSAPLFPSSIAIAEQLLTSDTDQAMNLCDDAGHGQPLSTVTFATLMPVPHRERSQSKPRKKIPSYEITSPECLSFVTDSMTKKRKGVQATDAVKRKDATKQMASKKPSRKRINTGRATSSSKSVTQPPEREYRCIYCDDVCEEPPPEPWSQCSVCLEWCHEACVPNLTAPFPANFACRNCIAKH